MHWLTMTISRLSYANRYLLYLIVISALPQSICAQAEAEDALLQQLSTPLLPSLGNSILIYQEGQQQQAAVQQASQLGRIEVLQQGNGHQLRATKQGIGNQWQIRQEGEGHEFSGLLRGDNNDVDVGQYGANNRLVQELIGDGMEYTIVQDGQNLELIQIEHNPQAPAYRVEQTGRDMRIIIEQGFAQPIPQP